MFGWQNPLCLLLMFEPSSRNWWQMVVVPCSDTNPFVSKFTDTSRIACENPLSWNTKNSHPANACCTCFCAFFLRYFSWLFFGGRLEATTLGLFIYVSCGLLICLMVLVHGAWKWWPLKQRSLLGSRGIRFQVLYTGRQSGFSRCTGYILEIKSWRLWDLILNKHIIKPDVCSVNFKKCWCFFLEIHYQKGSIDTTHTHTIHGTGIFTHSWLIWWIWW